MYVLLSCLQNSEITDLNQAMDTSKFVDLEASVSGSEPDEEEEASAEEMADFLDDNEESDKEDDTCLTMSHRELNRMLDVEEQHTAWRELLALEEIQLVERRSKLRQQSTCDEEAMALRKDFLKRSRQPSLDCNDIFFYDPYDTYERHFYPDRIRAPSSPVSAPAGITGLLPPPEHDKCLWRVSVKRGREEALAFTLFNRAIATDSKVSSVIGRLSTPGWIYIEAKDLKDVQQLCTDVIDIHMNKIVSIPSKDAPSILREVPYTYPKLGDWVRVTKGRLYKGDLAWVLARVDNLTHDLLVVPRVELFPPKRKRNGIPFVRPPQCRLEFGKLVDLNVGVTKANVAPQNDLPHFSEPRRRIPTNVLGDYDTETGLPLIVDFYLRRHRYVEGYRVLRTQDFKLAMPTAQELAMFTECPLISTTIIANARLMLDALRLQSGDPVKIIDGDTRGAIGHVIDIDANLSRATIALLEGPAVDVSLDVLRKTLSVGDSVCVVEGNYAGFTGWIVSITVNTVHLFDDRTGEAIEVAPHQLIFYEEEKTIYKTRPGPAPRAIPRVQSPNERFVGREVKIIRGSFKDYEGRVKNTERGDVLNIEIQATMQQRQFSMADLAHLHDVELRPLITFAHKVGDLPEFKATERMLPPMPPSSRPLVPSTPIPEGSSAEMGRAWNPSSRTPNPSSGF
ncbi:hypothetical protein H0H92_008149, partial [Tricholoma furcatifolium]